MAVKFLTEEWATTMTEALNSSDEFGDRADYLRVDVTPSEGARVAEALAHQNLYPSELRPDEVDLETVFMELTGIEADDKS